MERPRERALKEGLASLRDCELIALVLRTGIGQRDAVALASSLLDRFGGVHGLLCQDAATLLDVKGLGQAKVAALVAIRELLKRAELAAMQQGPVIEGADMAKDYLGMHIGRSEREVFGLMLLNSRNHLLAMEDVFFGTVDRTTVHTREVVKCCLRHNAAAVIMFHNHPSGDSKPSARDVALTRRLNRVLDQVDVRLLDHLVVANMKVSSMAQLGHIKSDYHV
ncbi:MAG: DNA repair protein RadC [Gammaproteobacteria bacterium]|nr:DNA repair protein RadC [Gammaproteobacteria bacterium]